MAKELETKIDDEVISMRKSELDEILQRLKRVEFAADKSHLAHFDNNQSKEKSKYVNLRSLDGKIIVGWSDMNSNIVEKNVNGAWFEDQTTTVFFDDKSETELTYAVFSRRYTQIPARVTEETVKNGELFFTVVIEDGREFKINSKFVN